MNENGANRLDRIERALELLIDDHVQFREEHKSLLTSQVLLTDVVRELAEAQKRTEEHLKRTDEQLAETGQRLNTLIEIVDGIVRKRPPPSE
jgi:hypothetical protein